MADEQKQRALRRLFQDLEQCVGAFTLEIVDRIDNGNPPATLTRCRTEERDRATHVVDADHGVKLAGLLIKAALEHEEVALRLRGHPARNRMIGVYCERCRFLDFGSAGVRMRQHETRQPIGQCGLADARRPAHQPGVRDAPAFVGFKERPLGVFMTKQDRRFARQLDVALVTAGLIVTHGAAVSAISAFGVSSRSCTSDHMRSDTTSRGARPSIMMQRFGSSAASAR